MKNKVQPRKMGAPERITTFLKGRPMAFFSKIYGTSHKNTDGTDRQEIIKKHCRKGMRLILKSEPNNQYDPHAIGIWVKVRVWFFFSKELQLGYINQELSYELSEYLKKNEIIVTISDVTGGGSKYYGVNIEIDKQGEEKPKIRTVPPHDPIKYPPLPKALAVVNPRKVLVHLKDYGKRKGYYHVDKNIREFLEARGWIVVGEGTVHLYVDPPEGVKKPFLLAVEIPTREQIERIANDLYNARQDWSGFIGEWRAWYYPPEEHGGRGHFGSFEVGDRSLWTASVSYLNDVPTYKETVSVPPS
jgi:hypothetical protein